MCVCCILCSKVQKVCGKFTGPLAGVFSEGVPCCTHNSLLLTHGQVLAPRQAPRFVSPVSTSFLSSELAHSFATKCNSVTACMELGLSHFWFLVQDVDIELPVGSMFCTLWGVLSYLCTYLRLGRSWLFQEVNLGRK